jgi:hypothetical protein
MTEIRRESIGAIAVTDSLMLSLSITAKEVLGYEVMDKALSKTSAAEMTSLQAALKALEIETLHPNDVGTYQKERLIEQTMANINKWILETKDLASVHSYNRFGGPAWVQEKIREYKQPIPEFVLAKAVQIKQAIPECEIYVESLEDYPDPFLLVAIPDGRAYYPHKESFYVEVWEEPKFEGFLRTASDVNL